MAHKGRGMSEYQGMSWPKKQGLYDPASEHDSCGVGFVAHMKGERSHQMILDGDQILRNMDHRGGCGCEPNTGDGAGMLTALPHEFLQKIAKEEMGFDLPEPGRFGAGNVFLPRDEAQRAICKEVIERIVAEEGQQLVGWRKVPVDPDGANLGKTARKSEPYIEQLFIAARAGEAGDTFERKLYLIRKRASHRLRGDENLSARRKCSTSAACRPRS